MSIMIERGEHSYRQEELPPVDHSREEVLVLNGRRNLWSDVCLGRLRLYDATGTVVELSGPPKPYPRPGSYYVRIAVGSFGEQPKGPCRSLPSSAMTTISNNRYVDVGSVQREDRYQAFGVDDGSSSEFRVIVLPEIERIELIVQKEEAEMIVQYIDEPPLLRTE